MPRGKRHQVTKRKRTIVEIGRSFGIPRSQIAKMVGLSDSHLDAHYSPELAIGKAKLIEKIGQESVWTMMQRKDLNAKTRMMIFFLKTRTNGEFAETQPVEKDTRTAAERYADMKTLLQEIAEEHPEVIDGARGDGGGESEGEGDLGGGASGIH